MAHEIETIAYANETPWHGLGVRVNSDISTDEMLKASGLDWTVNQYPMQAIGPDGPIDVPNKFALVRDKDNKVLTVSSENWRPVQNSQVFDFMRSYIESGGATMETAGSLRGGNIIWALANLDHEFSVSKGDKVKGYLLITSAHLVGIATKVRTTNVRVVCANTLAMAERDAGNVNYRQNHMAEFNVENAKKAVANAHDDLVKAEKRYKQIHKLKIGINDVVKNVWWSLLPDNIYTDENVEKIMADVDIQSPRLKALLNSYHNAPGAEVGTGWGALNAVTHFADHVAGRGGEARMYRSTFGDLSEGKREVERKLLELC